ncbi:MAG: hypothetical protein AB7N70_32275 [Dehalococcoidia bacterium]
MSAPWPPLRPSVCRVCGVTVFSQQPRRYCSDRCTAQTKRRPPPRRPARRCATCGTGIAPGVRRRYCSDDCQAIGEPAARAKAAARRARSRGKFTLARAVDGA